jgi:hypothetical protein
MNQGNDRMVSRRRLFAGAAGIGAVAAVASVAPGAVHESLPQPQAKEPPARGGGYQLSEHVKQYYKSARV